MLKYLLPALLAASPAAAIQCGQADAVRDVMRARYVGQQVITWLSYSGQLVEVWTHRDGRFTAVVTAPDGRSCIAAEGQSARTYPAGAPA